MGCCGCLHWISEGVDLPSAEAQGSASILWCCIGLRAFRM